MSSGTDVVNKGLQELFYSSVLPRHSTIGCTLLLINLIKRHGDTYYNEMISVAYHTVKCILSMVYLPRNGGI